jgi:hypothetical protein
VNPIDHPRLRVSVALGDSYRVLSSSGRLGP